ncbi:MAG: hypothetical protein C0616_14910, partial [Desulfuromonas sp.]
NNPMIKLFTPENDVQLAMLKGLFESEGIHFFVHNDNFGSMSPGIRIVLFNKKTIMVQEQDLDRAQEILRNFLDNIEETEPEPGSGSSNYSLLDKCRMVIEALLFGWVMPGKRWQRKKKSGDQSTEDDA